MSQTILKMIGSFHKYKRGWFITKIYKAKGNRYVVEAFPSKKYIGDYYGDTLYELRLGKFEARSGLDGLNLIYGSEVVYDGLKSNKF